LFFFPWNNSYKIEKRFRNSCQYIQVYLYLLLSIGFRAGKASAQSFHHGDYLGSIIWALNLLSVYCFFSQAESLVLKFGCDCSKRLVSAVTFVTAVTLEMQKYTFQWAHGRL
jgi:hypothetical protein